MENDTQKLLIGIGQPEFSYRSFNSVDAQAVVRKWPLVEHLAGHPLLQTSLGQANRPRTTGLGNSANPAGMGPAKAGFLKAYDPADHHGSREQSSTDVRALLGRLSKDIS